MNRPPLSGSIRSLILVMAVLLPAYLAAGCATQRVPNEVADRFENGANSLVFERQELDEPLTYDTPAEAFYVDARQYLEANNIEIATSNDESLVLTTEPKQVASDLALKLRLDVREAPAGSRLIATSEYAPTIGAEEGSWQQSRWTSGASKRAFEHTYSTLAQLPHSDLYAAVE